MPDRGHAKSGGVSLDTIIVASLASVTAMLITSHFWKGGTVISAAMTPVIVALASEAYRRPARKVTQLAPAVKRLTPAEARLASRGRSRGGTLTAPRPEQRAVERNGGSSNENGSGVTVYRPRRNLHLKAAIATGLVAFVIGALVLTVPELVFGGSVTTGSRTTLFGGGHSSAARSKEKTTTQPQQTEPQQSPGAASPTPTAPEQQPAQTTPAAPPAQTAPAPQVAPPSSGGGSAPPAQTAPAP
ncbi:MAG: hypothetical protein ACJ76V_05770 [Thermoleophilaceae bacterium]